MQNELDNQAKRLRDQNKNILKLKSDLNDKEDEINNMNPCLLYTSPSPRDLSTSRMPSSA